MSKQKKSKLSVKAAEFIPSSKKSTKSAPAQIMMPSQSASSSMIVHPLRYSTYNILSTFRCVEVQESPEMVKKRYTSIIKQIISNNSDFYVLQEIDKTFELFLNNYIKSKHSVYGMTKPKYFNMRHDTIGVTVLFKKSTCKLIHDYTEDCQDIYLKINKSQRFVPFRGQCCLFEYNSIPIIISNVHHSRQASIQLLDDQLIKTLHSILMNLTQNKLIHHPFILGGDFYYSGTDICDYFIHQTKIQYDRVPIVHNTSYHKYYKPSLSEDRIQIRKSSNTTDQIIFNSSIGLVNYSIHPIEGMGSEDHLPYIYPKLPKKSNYTQDDFDKTRQVGKSVYSDHALVTAEFYLYNAYNMHSVAYGLQKKSRRKVKKLKKSKNKKIKKSRKGSQKRRKMRSKRVNYNLK